MNSLDILGSYLPLILEEPEIDINIIDIIRGIAASINPHEISYDIDYILTHFNREILGGKNKIAIKILNESHKLIVLADGQTLLFSAQENGSIMADCRSFSMSAQDILYFMSLESPMTIYRALKNKKDRYDDEKFGGEEFMKKYSDLYEIVEKYIEREKGLEKIDENIRKLERRAQKIKGEIMEKNKERILAVSEISQLANDMVSNSVYSQDRFLRVYDEIKRRERQSK